MKLHEGPTISSMAINECDPEMHAMVMLIPCIATAGFCHKGKVAAVQTAPQHQHGSVHTLAHMSLFMRNAHGKETLPGSGGHHYPGEVRMPVPKAGAVGTAAAWEAGAASLLSQACPPMKASPLSVPC